MKMAILGGSFNPVHIAHLFIADEILHVCGYDKIAFIPACLPAHKDHQDILSAEHRLKMVELSIRGNDNFMLDSCELERGGISYSIDTVRHLKSKYKITGKPGLIIGDDLVDGFKTWKDHEKLADLVTLIIVRRTAIIKKDFLFNHEYIENSLFPISSTEIRERICSAKAYRYLLPHEVAEYIEKHEIYCCRSV
jgi:nicotinate-nucleotide adenylyltransferase